MGGYTGPTGELAASVEDVYRRFPRLEERRRQVAGTLSGGEQQMLAMGRALMSHPKLLIDVYKRQGQQLHGPLVGQQLRIPVPGQAEDPRPHIIVDVVVQAQLHVVLHAQVGRCV